MLTSKEIITNQLLGTIYVDKSDKTVLHINMDSALKILINNDLNIPKKQYENTLEVLLSRKIVGTPAGVITKIAISELMYNLATEMAISKEEIIKYNLKNPNVEGINITD